MLANVSCEEGQPAVGWGGTTTSFPGMDGDERWRCPGIGGMSAVYPGNAPSTPVSTAPPQVLVIWPKMKYCVYTQYILIDRYGMESNQSSTLLGRVREVIRYEHYSMRTERSYVEWLRRFVAFHWRRYLREMGADEVRAFLGHLASDLKVAASTHHQALSALLFLYREVLELDGVAVAGQSESPDQAEAFADGSFPGGGGGAFSCHVRDARFDGTLVLAKLH